jgi:lipopolysaccharide/colanic/teichoic acid biosynthesis glycosyltransferase
MDNSSPEVPVSTPEVGRGGDDDLLPHLSSWVTSRARLNTAAAPVSRPVVSTDTPRSVATVREPPTPTSVEAVAEVTPAERMELLARAVNVIVAGIALLILAPVCVLVALVVKLSSRGPVFYTQTRVGIDRRWSRTSALHERRVENLGGQPFTILKFRSMRIDAEPNGQAVWATKHDSRVTPVGRVLRKTRLDEIPQLINVLRGDMNIVGPRPERPSIVVRLRNEIAEYPYRHRVKPGITGWAQINHSYDSSIEDVRKKVRFDLEYIQQQGLWFDFKIMLLTLPVMLFRRGAH